MHIGILLLIFSSLFLAGCMSVPVSIPAEIPGQPEPSDMPDLSTPSPVADQPAPYPDLGPAPELTNDTWLNVHSPLRLADLRGKVVLIDMWTFG
jgi:hypothetical protein